MDADRLSTTDTETLKAYLIEQVTDRDAAPIAQKVKFANEHLMPLFTELERRNPIPDLAEQIPVMQGIWRSLWSTIPFQDILPGRLRDQSYQIFAPNGYYANLARYKPGHRTPLLNWLARRLFSYDLMIVQTYAVAEDAAKQTQRWDIQNVGIRQVLRWGTTPFDAGAAQTWFDRAVKAYLANPNTAQNIVMPEQNVSRSMEKKYQKVFKSQPVLEHLYIDSDLRVVKSQREKSQRPSYTVAVRLE
ncbi:MAG: hypothetical protein F6J87_18520 [Spirulina sp. SIO3F2]|nr:hypothetical protein [Spirulina sp. SIO3F2]